MSQPSSSSTSSEPPLTQGANASPSNDAPNAGQVPAEQDASASAIMATLGTKVAQLDTLLGGKIVEIEALRAIVGQLTASLTHSEGVVEALRTQMARLESMVPGAVSDSELNACRQRVTMILNEGDGMTRLLDSRNHTWIVQSLPVLNFGLMIANSKLQSISATGIEGLHAQAQDVLTSVSAKIQRWKNATMSDMPVYYGMARTIIWRDVWTAAVIARRSPKLPQLRVGRRLESFSRAADTEFAILNGVVEATQRAPRGALILIAINNSTCFMVMTSRPLGARRDRVQDGALKIIHLHNLNNAGVIVPTTIRDNMQTNEAVMTTHDGETLNIADALTLTNSGVVSLQSSAFFQTNAHLIRSGAYPLYTATTANGATYYEHNVKSVFVFELVAF